ncbi:hypothetical protein MC885_013384, partial [Smutsia gigantea]
CSLLDSIPVIRLSPSEPETGVPGPAEEDGSRSCPPPAPAALRTHESLEVGRPADLVRPRPRPGARGSGSSREPRRKQEAAVQADAWGGESCWAMAEKFDHLEEHLEKFVENIRQLGIIVSDFQPSSQAGLNQKLNFIVTGLQDIDKCRQQLHDITVPLEVFEYIDQGRNPQLYTKECLERALAKNEQVKGKIDTMKKFKSLLIQELSKVFPEDMAKYRSIRGEDHPPS